LRQPRPLSRPATKRTPLDGGPFLRLSAIQKAVHPDSKELDRLDGVVTKLERSQRWRSTAQVDLDPYAVLLRSHLRAARAAHDAIDPAFVQTTARLVELLQRLTDAPPRARSRLHAKAG